ncbi:hypothetical protein HYY73_03470 [Candidatus Woesearchaeota archaeon]|nr:hypothetical protein [Candidatus Woesearchaeota archaeon]
MKKGASKASSKVFRQLRREIDMMHKATADFVGVCIDIAKAHPRGLKRIKKNVYTITGNMFKLDKLYAGLKR